MAAILEQLGLEEMAATGATHKVVVTHSDLTETTVSTAQTLTPITVANLTSWETKFALLRVPFANTADTGFNSVAVTMGDGGSTNRFLTSTELCENGTEVAVKVGTGTTLQYTTDDTVDLVFTPATGYALSALNKGEVWFYGVFRDGRGYPTL